MPAVCAVVALLVVLAARQWLSNRDARVRLDTITEANRHAETFRTMQNAAWQRRYDSLRVDTRRRDTVLVTRVRTVRELVAALPVQQADTALRVCVAAVDTLATDCERFRVSATAALVAADSLHQADTTRIAAMALDRVLASDSIATAITQRNHRPSWTQALGVGAVLGGIGYIIGPVTP